MDELLTSVAEISVNTKIILVCVGAIIVCIGAIAQPIYRRMSRVSRKWKGVITSYHLKVDRTARKKGSTYPLKQSITIMNLDTQESQESEIVPLAVRRQVYKHPFFINEYKPNLTLTGDSLSEAREQAEDDGYEYELPSPIFVSVKERENGFIVYKTMKGFGNRK